MPYQPRQFTPIPLPQVESPLRSLSDMMSLAGGLQQYEAQGRRMKDEEKARQRENAIDAALTETKGHFGKAAERLDAQGQWEAATLLRDEADKRRSAAVSSAITRTKQYESLFGQAAQMLQEVSDTPDLYPQLRPRLVDLATTLDPRLASEIPEQYDPDRVRGMVQFVQGADQRAKVQSRALKAFQDSQTMTDDRVKRAKSQTEAVGGMLSIAPNEEYWNHILEIATDWGVGEDVVGAFRKIPWSTTAPATAAALATGKPPSAPTNFDAAILAAHQRGDEQGKQQLIALQGTVAAARRAPDENVALNVPAAVEILKRYPTTWGDLTPTMRDKLFLPLGQTGFDFSAAARGLSAATKADIERWFTNAISDLNTRQDDPLSLLSPEKDTDGQRYKAEHDRLTASYRAQLGLGQGRNDRPTSPSVPTDFEGVVEQNGVRYRIKTDSTGKVISSQVVR